jgi:hypothetical protein
VVIVVDGYDWVAVASTHCGDQTQLSGLPKPDKRYVMAEAAMTEAGRHRNGHFGLPNSD